MTAGHSRLTGDPGQHRAGRGSRAAGPGREPTPARPGDTRSTIAHLQRAAGNASVADLLDGDGSAAGALQQVVAGGGGAPLDASLRAGMESAFGADFSSVRIHRGGAAAESAGQLGARAYTVGEDIVLGEGGAEPRTLAHELAHVVQQRQGPVDGTDLPGGLRVSDPGDRFERAAEEAADGVTRAAAPGPGPDAGRPSVQAATDETGSV